MGLEPTTSTNTSTGSVRPTRLPLSYPKLSVGKSVCADIHTYSRSSTFIFIWLASKASSQSRARTRTVNSSRWLSMQQRTSSTCTSRPSRARLPHSLCGKLCGKIITRSSQRGSRAAVNCPESIITTSQCRWRRACLEHFRLDSKQVAEQDASCHR